MVDTHNSPGLDRHAEDLSDQGFIVTSGRKSDNMKTIMMSPDSQVGLFLFCRSLVGLHAITVCNPYF